MLKKRVCAALVMRDGWIVQSIGFKKYLPVGTPEVAIEYLSNWGIDEISLVDISATRSGLEPDFERISRVAKKCFVPLAVGGGLKSVEQMRRMIRLGADKVIVNRAAVVDPNLVSAASKVLGKQCVIVSIDAIRDASGSRVYSYLDRTMLELTPVELARRAEKAGAGEILLNSVDRDGSKSGFDVELIREVAEAVDIAVIAVGGAGHPEHLGAALKQGKADAVAAGNIFHFSEHSVITAKNYLCSQGFDVRIDSAAAYDGFGFDERGRITKLADEALYQMQFAFRPREII